MPVIILQGKASNSQKLIPVKTEDLDKSLLLFLQEHHIPIASSCRGMGSCCKCYFNETKLTCQEQVSQYLDEVVSIDYL